MKPSRISRCGWIFAVLLIALAACSSSGSDSLVVPTRADFDTLPTARFLTENAPPPGFGSLQLDPIDTFLADQPGWTYTVTGSFDGVFDATGEPAAGAFEVQVQANELGQTRRVVLEAQGAAFLPENALLRLEGVRFSNDYYIVDVNGLCTVDEGGTMGGSAIADLAAGQLIGGVSTAVPSGYRQEIEGLSAWQYTFTAEAMRLPAVHQIADSRVALEADLWVAPGVRAVVRYEVTATVRQVYLLWANQDAADTVSGTLYLRYELNVPELGTLPNISVPHGC